jgi:hypothetical protein
MAIATEVKRKQAELEDAFAPAREAFVGLLGTLSSTETLGLEHSKVEALTRDGGFEVLRLVLQGHLDLRGVGEVASGEVVGSDDVARTHARLGSRTLMSMFGAVVVERVAYGGRGLSGLSPKDAHLNLPARRYSHGVQRLAAETAAKLSFDETVKAIERDTGASVPKRQLELVVAHAATDFDEFYETRKEASRREVAQTASIMALTSDAKGIVVHTEDLREATKKAADKKAGESRERFGLGRKAAPVREDRKRMATLAAVYTIAPFHRAAADVVGELGRLRLVKGERPRPEDKWVCASVTDNAIETIEKAFREALRRDPQAEKRWVGLVDGNEDQIEIFRGLAGFYGVSITLILDFIHVAGYVWAASKAFNPVGSKEAEEWVRERFLKILRGKSSDVAAGMRRSATKRGLSSGTRAPVDKCADYLLKYASLLRYDEYLRDGLPIATGVIEGACRHLVQDRMDITGAVWRLKSAEAVLKLRAICTNEDFHEYWAFHEKQDHLRNHAQHYEEKTPPPVVLPDARRRPALRVVK